MKTFLACVAAFLLAAVAPAVFAAQIAYINTPFDTPNSAVNTLIQSINGSTPSFSYLSSCSGTTTATCTGLKVSVSITGLTTAASAVSATMTVTDTAVTAASQIQCQVNGYTGTGVPNAVNVVAAAGSFTFAIQNTAASAALNATVATACAIFN